MKKNILYLIVVLLLHMIVYGNEPMVVINKDNPLNSISQNDLKKIFVGDKQKWEAGKIEVCVLQGSFADSFNEKYLRLSTQKLNKIWFTKIFQGEVIPPNKFKSSEDLLEFVRNNKSAIGYVERINIKDKVKVLTVE